MDATFETDFKGNTYADDAVLTDELNQLVSDGALCVALAVGLEVTQVTDVADLVLGGTVGLVVGVDCCSSAQVRPCLQSAQQHLQ